MHSSHINRTAEGFSNLHQDTTPVFRQRVAHSQNNLLRFGSHKNPLDSTFDDLGMEPFKQGQLDHLCGIYAIINAINLASNDTVIDHNWAMAILSSVLPIATELASDDAEGFIGLSSSDLSTIAKIILHGLNAAGLHYRLVSPVKYFRHAGEKHLSKQQILRRATHQETNQSSEDYQLASPANNQPLSNGHALIMQLRTPMSFHWTVMKAKRGKIIDLFDSTNIGRTKVKYCRPWKVIVEG